MCVFRLRPRFSVRERRGSARTCTFALAASLLAALPACSDAGDHEIPSPLRFGVEELISDTPSDRCPSPSDGEAPAGDAILRVSRVQCRPVAVHSVILAPSLTREWPDPARWSTFAQDSRGRLYSGAGGNRLEGAVLVWAPDGSFAGSLGRPGQGPGEFPNELLSLFTGTGDTLYVVSQGRLTVFDANQRFVRATAGPAVNPRLYFGATRMVAGNSFLSVGSVWGIHDADRRFHLAGPDGKHRRSFGAASALTEVVDRHTPRVAYAGDSTFWTIGGAGGESAYVLEQWHLDGNLVRRLNRDAEWWERNAVVCPEMKCGS